MDSTRGIVIPAGWNNYDNIMSAAIATRDAKEYIIENHRNLSGVNKFLRQEVMANGCINAAIILSLSTLSPFALNRG
jgi:hypothetical protein